MAKPRQRHARVPTERVPHQEKAAEGAPFEGSRRCSEAEFPRQLHGGLFVLDREPARALVEQRDEGRVPAGVPGTSQEQCRHGADGRGVVVERRHRVRRQRVAELSVAHFQPTFLGKTPRDVPHFVVVVVEGGDQMRLRIVAQHPSAGHQALITQRGLRRVQSTQHRRASRRVGRLGDFAERDQSHLAHPRLAVASRVRHGIDVPRFAYVRQRQRRVRTHERRIVSAQHLGDAVRGPGFTGVADEIAQRGAANLDLCMTGVTQRRFERAREERWAEHESSVEPMREPRNPATASSRGRCRPGLRSVPSNARLQTLPETPHPPPPNDAALSAYVRRSVVRALAFTVVLFGAIALCNALWGAELLAATTWVHDEIGLIGLLLLVAFADAITSPIPPDAALVVVSKSALAANWPLVVLTIGAVSSAAGCVGYLLGTRLKSTPYVQRRLARKSPLLRQLVLRYGPWAVLLGAVTPIPFSVTCWLAGIFALPFRKFAPIALVRVPRFFVYYWLIVLAEGLSGSPP